MTKSLFFVMPASAHRRCDDHRPGHLQQNTDMLIPGLDVPQIVVPDKMQYQTSKGTLFKARALYCSAESLSPRDEDWLLHMDEVSFFNTDCIGVALSWLRTPERQPTDIAQELISYNNVPSLESFSHYICTIADSVRVADDLFRFQLQYDLVGSAPFGVLAASCS